MRLILILAFVSSVFFNTDPAAARPGADPTTQARKQAKVQKPRAARSATNAKPTSKRAKASRNTKARTDEAAGADEAQEVAPAPKVETPQQVKRAPVAQTTDDEVPANEPKKRR